jgi:hypothetical protein
MNTKSAVLAEMAALWIATMLIAYSKQKTKDFNALFVDIGIKSGLAIGVLTVILVVPVDLNPGVSWPAYAGLLIAGSALLYEGGIAANEVNALLAKLQGKK